jgi:predicted dehydrogenase
VDRVRWAILGTAKIATTKVIPAMQKCESAEIVAIASRDLERSRRAAKDLHIPRSYGSYEDALADPAVEAVYIPLPNHLHVPWSLRAAEAGKHVLCEKPIALSPAECRTLMAVRDRTAVKIGEAFMVRAHPQWLRAKELVRAGAIGDLRSVIGAFSYFNRDPANIRNIPAFGGGAVMDIGCYPIHISRFLFGQEPMSVMAQLDRDPDFGTDRLSSVILGFPSGHSVFTCGTQLVSYQRVQILGTKARIEIEIPYNAPPDRPTHLFLDGAAEEFPVCDQYTIQGDLFSRAVRGEGDVPVPLEDSLRNMAVIEAVFESARTGSTVQILA